MGTAYVRTYQDICHMLNGSQQKPKPSRQHSTHKRQDENKRCPNSKSNKERDEKYEDKSTSTTQERIISGGKNSVMPIVVHGVWWYSHTKWNHSVDHHFFFPIPFIIFALLLPLPPSRNSDPGSHNRLVSPPPTTIRALHSLLREDFSCFFPRRLASNCAYPR